MAFAPPADHLLQGGKHHAKTLVVLTLHPFSEWHFRNTSAAVDPGAFVPDEQGDGRSSSDRHRYVSWAGLLYGHLFQQIDVVEDSPSAEDDRRQRILRNGDR